MLCTRVKVWVQDSKLFLLLKLVREKGETVKLSEVSPFSLGAYMPLSHPGTGGLSGAMCLRAYGTKPFLCGGISCIISKSRGYRHRRGIPHEVFPFLSEGKVIVSGSGQ